MAVNLQQDRCTNAEGSPLEKHLDGQRNHQKSVDPDTSITGVEIWSDMTRDICLRSMDKIDADVVIEGDALVGCKMSRLADG